MSEKVHEQILLCPSYHEGGKVKKRTVLNLTHFPREQVEAIEWALKNLDLAALAQGGGRIQLAGASAYAQLNQFAQTTRQPATHLPQTVPHRPTDKTASPQTGSTCKAFGAILRAMPVDRFGENGVENLFKQLPEKGLRYVP